MLGSVNDMIAELSSYFTDVQISLIKYAITALLVTSTSFYLLRKSLGRESAAVTTKKPKMRIKKSKSKSSDGRTSSSDGDYMENKKPLVVPRNAAVINTQKAQSSTNAAVEFLPESQNLTKDEPINEYKSDDWVTVKKGKRTSDQHIKNKATIKETKTITSEFVTLKGKDSERHLTRTVEINGVALPSKLSKKLPPVPQIPPYKLGGSESDGDWHEVRFSRKGRKTAKQ
ncbi:hypothetical protein MN116_001833 [Schistosoma mekongi]|uniref:Uncharacterized protein n=1 Tax=Schistosoma mekongi TaxID=38744 RepID=A0AAE1ZIK4_SCHME|nr:hypothetical protein MN116_001833 [Schistosoma mekongi]